ncbi:hypothetical protein DRQ32_11600 [bacterium]|nr:MAG: hypothetical protein DRQ32_11600 [bacterium]
MATAFPTAKSDSCADTRNAMEQRRVILGPCLAAMGFSEHGAPPPELPESLVFNGAQITLESWERNLLLGNFGGETAVLLAHFSEGLAFRALSGSRLSRLEAELPKPRELERTRLAMMEETAVGIALQQELQRDIDRLVAKGEMGDAKKLTGFRRKIDKTLAQLEQRIGVQAHEQALARSVELLTPRDTARVERRRKAPPVETGLTLEDLYALEATLAKQVVEQPPEPSADELIEASLREQTEGVPATVRLDESETSSSEPARRFRSLLILLAVCAVAYTVFLFKTHEAAPPPRLSIGSFEHIDGVLSVKARPPSLFVRVKASSWSKLPAEEKTQVVEEFGRIAGESGYQGVQIKTGDGTNVAQWLRKTGVRIMVAREIGS